MFRKWIPLRYNYVADVLILSLLAVSGTFIGYAFVSREVPVQVLRRDLNSLVVNPYDVNDTFDYTTYFIRKRWCETKVNRWFVDSSGRIHYVAPLPYSMRTDGLFYPQESVTKVEVPITIQSGPTEWCFRPEWKCNWTQREWFPVGPILGQQECLTFWVDNPVLPYPEVGEPN
jgi:hypothetical protein